MSFEITGLEEMMRQLDDAIKALEALEGQITTVNFDPEDPASIEAAIRQVEVTIDAKVQPYESNPVVASLVDEMKEKYRTAILERAASARLER